MTTHHLNIDVEGNFTFDGQPWLLAAFLTKLPVQMITTFTAMILPYPFTVETPDGELTGNAGDYLVKGSDGIWVISPAEFQKKFRLAA